MCVEGIFVLILFVMLYFSHIYGIHVAVWLSGNVLVSINEVTLCRAQLVVGLMTVCG